METNHKSIQETLNDIKSLLFKFTLYTGALVAFITAVIKYLPTPGAN